MIWLTWHQHRSEAIGLAALLTVLGVLALIAGLPMYAAYQGDGVAACHEAATETAACSQIVDSFRDTFGGLPMLAAGQLNLLPLIIGVLIGAPLLAREYEQGTWQLAWTQAVPRTRWIITKLALVLTAVASVAIALSAMLSWWLSPFVRSPFSVERFNYGVLVLPGYFLLAVAIGILAGAVIKRAIPAMVATLAVFLPIRILVEFWLRPRFMTPVTTVDPVPGSSALTHQLTSGKNWVLETFLVGPSGDRLTDSQEYHLLGGGQVDQATLAEHGLKEGVIYHPASRFWEFQLIESAIYGGLALVVLLLAVWRIRRW
ncbi:ABC transporter permease [Tenggerimyces flavus]|uniref:ABC transporter permease n=1 Tax=Tenggerimyces flavus TaxID=1708749 RepID=A0ABV7Y5N5_9ACTN|nr:ABC transporter permease [Tenggerimyces flavus]MBM7790086.1 hypothetical protein [Tenggerimyces flavus]